MNELNQKRKHRSIEYRKVFGGFSKIGARRIFGRARYYVVTPGGGEVDAR